MGLESHPAVVGLYFQGSLLAILVRAYGVPEIIQGKCPTFCTISLTIFNSYDKI